jgi:hypothetical protein
MNTQHWQDWLVAVVGLWLIISNWLLGYAPAELMTGNMIFWNSILSGIAALVLGLAALSSFRIWEEWADVVLGAWLVVSPWVLGFIGMELASWNVMACGIILIVSAVWTIYDEREAGTA